MQLTEDLRVVLCAEPSKALDLPRLWKHERDCAEEAVFILLALCFSLESSPVLEEGNVCFIFCMVCQGLWGLLFSSWPLTAFL